MDCHTPGSFCIAAAQQKNVPNSIGTNLRNFEPIEVISLCFDLIPIRKRPFVFKSEYAKFFRDENSFMVTVSFS